MRHMIFAAGLLAAVAVPLQAQDVCSQYRPTPAMGSWAQYTSSRDGQDFTTRIALVGQEKRDGKDALWFESSSETPRGKMVSEVLVPTYPFAPDAVIEAVVKRGDQPAMKVSGSMMGMMRGQGGQGQGGQGASAPAGQGGMARGGRGGGMGRGGAMSNWTEQCRNLSVVGQESVKVPAGTFTATHLHNAADSTDVWVSREVPFGMVKTQSPRGSMALSAMGKDAKKSITETPQAMPGM
jgi:hypothetical protein